MSKKSTKKLLQHYVSDIDLALAKFDRAHSPSQAQKEEIEKYQWVYKRRDHALPQKHKKSIWNFE